MSFYLVYRSAINLNFQVTCFISGLSEEHDVCLLYIQREVVNLEPCIYTL